MMNALREAFTGVGYKKSISHTKAHTPGRIQALRDEGWDGVKGTEKQVKYRKLEKLQNRLKDTNEQVSDFRQKRDNQNPTTEAWARLHRRMNTFKDAAHHLEERIRRQKDKIAAQEA